MKVKVFKPTFAIGNLIVNLSRVRIRMKIFKAIKPNDLNLLVDNKRDLTLKKQQSPCSMCLIYALM